MFRMEFVASSFASTTTPSSLASCTWYLPQCIGRSPGMATSTWSGVWRRQAAARVLRLEELYSATADMKERHTVELRTDGGHRASQL
eukprot:g15766.t1